MDSPTGTVTFWKATEEMKPSICDRFQRDQFNLIQVGYPRCQTQSTSAIAW
jgi:hypothetical protein